ncbi:MAG: hypothetical protein OXC26_08240, partial [Albidovulum sp.]|nr:hypothetical protein [Albidovulum sp.]
MADGFRDDVVGWRCCRDRSILRPMDRVAAEQDIYFSWPWSPFQNCPFVVGFAPRSVSGRHDACRERGENRDAAFGLRPRASQLQTPQACLPPPVSCHPQFNRSWIISDTPKHDDMQVRHAAAAGLDVYRMQVTATVRTHAGREAPVVETREFSALASGLFLLVQWLLGLRAGGAVMEATGVYWEKVYDILSHAG